MVFFRTGNNKFMNNNACHGPLCPLLALYGAEQGRELYEWLQNRTANLSITTPALEPSLNERDYFLVVPVKPSIHFLDSTIPGRDVPYTGLHLRLQSSGHPLRLDWHKIAVLARHSPIMVNFSLFEYSPDEYRLVVEDLLAAAENGVRWLRLDASQAIHQPDGAGFMSRIETHGYVQLLKRTLETTAPHIGLVMGEDASQKENFSFFSNGAEADMIESLALAPLLLHSLESGQARALETWAGGLRLPFPGFTFYNTFGPNNHLTLRCVEEFLSPLELEKLAGLNIKGGGFMSVLAALPGSEQFYRLQARLHAAQAILLALTGIPGFESASLPGERLLKTRASCQAFHPYGAQLTIPGKNPAIFSLLRIAPDGRSTALCLQNVSGETQETRFDLEALGFHGGAWVDLAGGEKQDLTRMAHFTLEGYQTRWLSPA